VYAQDPWTQDWERERSPEHPSGRYPANLAHDGSEEVLEAFAEFGGNTGAHGRSGKNYGPKPMFSGPIRETRQEIVPDLGSAARFFFCAKASREERGEGNSHPTVKPLALMEWLVRLACPAGGLVLDPFAGSGTTILACLRTDRRCLAIEREPRYAEIIRARAAREEAREPLFLPPAAPAEAQGELF
jgi:site-specific DNA-methyltransferase (adenine-specific)